jgi:hypothetical protein
LRRSLSVISLTFICMVWGIFGQANFTELGGYSYSEGSLGYLEHSTTRTIIPMTGKWGVRFADDPANTSKQVEIPSSFESESELIFERTLPFEPKSDKNYRLTFLGVSNKAEVSLNGRMIYRHLGGTFPFSFLLPKDVLKKTGKNIITVKVNGNLDNKETFPFKFSFLYPYSNKGIFREVFIQELPNIFIGDYSSNYQVTPNGNKVELNINSSISNRNYGRAINDSIGNKFELVVSVKTKEGEGERIGAVTEKFAISAGKDQESALTLTISDPRLWTPAAPYLYEISFALYSGDILIDEIAYPAGFFLFKSGDNSFNLNNGKFALKGVTYIPSLSKSGAMFTNEEMARDIRLIKGAGFNSVRFEKNIPHPYLLYLCAREGLLAFIEMPISNLPASFSDDPLLSENLRSFAQLYLKGYKNFSTIAGFGLGTGYLGNRDKSVELLKSLSVAVKKNTGKMVYASFAILPKNQIEGLDAYGIEFINRPTSEILRVYQQAAQSFGAGRLMVASAGYIIDPEKSRTGNKHSAESQAKFFEDILMYASVNQNMSFFLSTMFDYRSNYQSIISGALNDQMVYLGLIPEDRGAGRLSYKVVDALLNNREKVTISLGFNEDDAPMIFIIFGLALALLTAMLLNTGKKFKEDALRAMLRPYNFYQDVRDYNQISPFITTYIGLLICAVMALLTSSLLFYWRYDSLQERILLSFGFDNLLSVASYLSWNPMESLLVLTLFYFVLAIFFTLLVKFGSLFVINRVTIQKSYLVVIWASLPFITALPGAILLYRVLNSEVANMIVYIILLLFFVWNIHRLLKGMYVVYDVPAFKVYFFSIFVVLVVVASWLFYYQLTNFTVEQIIQVYLESRAG